MCRSFSFQVCLLQTSSVRNFGISTTYVPTSTIKTMASYNASHQVVVNVEKMSDNSNNVHFSGVRFIYSPYLAIR